MSKSPSLSKKASKGGKKNEKVEVTLLSDTIYSSSEFEEKLFPEWNEETLKLLMERDKQLLAPEESTQTTKRPPSTNKKKGSGTDDALKDVVAQDSSEIVFNEKCLEFSSQVKEWKSIKTKWEPRISRDLFPSHPYFDRVKAKEPPKSAVSESKSKSKKVEEKEPVRVLPELTLDSDEDEIIVEDFEKYSKILDISNKGGWTKAFVSALYQIEECKEMIPFESYLWERIWPKKEGSDVLPDVSPWGRYYIKLRYKGKDRIVIVDDKLPHDANGKIMFPISPYDEFWPSILLKGIIALTKGEEHLAFTDPLWCFSCLFSDFSMQPVSCESLLDVISPLTQSLQSHKQWKSSFSLVKYLCRAPTDCDPTKRKLMFLKCKKDVDIDSQGLKKDNLFRIEDISVFKGHTLLRVISNDVVWSGKYSYKNASIWTADFENEIGFCYQDRRIEKRMKDFWIDLEEMQEYFDCIYVAHEITQYKTVAFLGKHVTTSPIVFYVTETSKLFVRVIGVKEEVKPKVSIQKASNWKKLTPSKLIHDFTISGFDSILPLTLPCKDDFDIFEIRFTNIESQYVEFISEKPLTFGKQEDIYTTKLSQSIQRTNTLSSPTHINNEFKVWSIHQLNIDKEGVFSARLLVDDISILPFTHLMLVNNETTDVVKSINGRIFPVKLFPSPQQYSLICYACPNRDLELTNYSLETISENDVFDLDIAKSLQLYSLPLKGRYYTNQERELFRYRIDAGEKANVAFRLFLSDRTPIKLTVLKVENENTSTLLEFQTFDNESEIVISNLVVFPSTKTASIGYLLVCTIDEESSLTYLESRLEIAGHEFQQFLRDKSKDISLSDLKLEEERPVIETKNSKKDSKKPASAKKPAANQKVKKEPPKIPSKQDKPVLLSSQYTEGCESSSASTLHYSIDIFSTTPNVIYQEMNLKKQKIDQLAEEWEGLVSQHADKGKAAREKFIKQNLARLISQKEHSPRAELKIEKREETENERKDREAKEKDANAKLIAEIKEKRNERSKSFEKYVNEITEQKLQTLATSMKDNFVENQKKIITLKEQTLEEEKKREIDRLNEEKNKKSLPNTARKPTK